MLSSFYIAEDSLVRNNMVVCYENISSGEGEGVRHTGKAHKHDQRNQMRILPLLLCED